MGHPQWQIDRFPDAEGIRRATAKQLLVTQPRRSTLWYAGLSAYWFATSYKWFILLLAVLPGQVNAIVPGGEKNTAWGMVFMIGAVWAVVGPSVFGYLSDRFTSQRGRRRPFIAIGAAATVVSLAILAGANQLWMLVVGYLLLQVSDDVGTGPYSALIPDVVAESDRGKASGWMGLMQLVGHFCSAIVGALLGSVVLIYVGIAVVNVLCALWVLALLRGVDVASERPAETPASFKEFLVGWKAPWASRDFRWVWFTRFLNALGFYMVQPYLRNYLEDVVKEFRIFGIAVGDGQTATLVIGLTISVLGAVGAGWAAKASDRIGRKRVIYSGGTLMAAVLVPIAFIPNYTVIWCLALGFGFGYGAFLSADWALVSDVLPDKEASGKDMGVWQSSISSVQIFAGGFGRVIDWGNRLQFGLGYSMTLVGAAVVFFIGTVLVRQVKGST
ncbi:MAG: MFS transporter [Chthonomonadaceae bacterium]|nr:MFS transporter [Chthonomonadaceae bacterium]